MTLQKPASQDASKKKLNFLGAITDLIILALLLTGTAFGGYWWGLNQRLAPVQSVPPGTAGALPPPGALSAIPLPAQSAAAPAQIQPAAQSTGSQPNKASSTSTGPSDASNSKKKSEKIKYWLSSSGAEYTGYSITVTVNGTAVDNFFGPGKNVDISRHVKDGENTVLFQAKALGDQYNKHKGDEKSVLTVQLISGPQMQEDFKPSDVQLTYKRNAAEDQDYNETQHFVKE